MSIKKMILDYLRWNARGEWAFAGPIGDHIRKSEGSKADTVSRRCRELENIGSIEARYIQVNGEGPKVVQYRIKNLLGIPRNLVDPERLKSEQQLTLM